MRCTIKKASSSNWWEEIFKVKDEKAKPEVEFKAGKGDHIFNFKGKTIWVHHSIGETFSQDGRTRPLSLRSFTFLLMVKIQPLLKISLKNA